MKKEFINEIKSGYDFGSLNSIIVGGAKLNDEVFPELEIKIPLKNFNKHGLISGATGTGKTKSMQILTELLVKNGVSVLSMDMKGDFSGVAVEGESNEKIEERMKILHKEWKPEAIPAEFITLNNEPGLKFRATISEFGPILFSRLLELNEIQESVISLIFKYCDDKAFPLVDLDDIKSVMLYLTNEGKEEIRKLYGQISSSTTSTIMRKIIQLEQQGGGILFGEPSFSVNDLLNGKVNILKVENIQDKPRLFSTCMLSILSEVYSSFPEIGDQDKPKLVIFIDEAHLIFDNATSALLNQLTTVIRLIRSKGVGIFFVTQLPTDIPEEILAQLGTKVQHALRAFTPNDNRNIKLTVDNYPVTNHYTLEKLVTELGTGETLITTLDGKGNPTPVAHTYMVAPVSRMGIISEQERAYIVNTSILAAKYDQHINKESAHELLKSKLELSMQENQTIQETKNQSKEKTTAEVIGNFAGSFGKNLISSMGRSFGTSLTRNILGSIIKK